MYMYNGYFAQSLNEQLQSQHKQGADLMAQFIVLEDKISKLQQQVERCHVQMSITVLQYM